MTAEGSLGFADLSPELSRDFRGLRVWLPLMLHGVAAFREQLAEKLALARWAYEELAADPRFEMLDEPQLSVVAFRLRAPEEDAERLGPELLRRVNARRRVFLSSTRIDGRYALRLCVLSFRTHDGPRARRRRRPPGRGAAPSSAETMVAGCRPPAPEPGRRCSPQFWTQK